MAPHPAALLRRCTSCPSLLAGAANFLNQLMNKHEIEEVLTVLGKGRRLFHYFEDRYALALLARVAGAGVPIHALKRSAFARLLHKPVVRRALSDMADGVLRGDALDAIWPAATQAYRLSLDWWGVDEDDWSPDCHQTSRPGFNLVLQCNFSRKHDAAYERLVRATSRYAFMSRCHPNAAAGSTLGWVRLDVDFAADEALVEEVQSDWIKEAEALRPQLSGLDDVEDQRELLASWQIASEPWHVLGYLDELLGSHGRIWSELLLLAALELIDKELGIRRIYYHSYESWKHMKNRNFAPPRSLYTRLPERFCFTTTTEPPAMLRRSQNNRVRCRLRDPVTWYQLAW
jgi:hypothetical protein